MNAPTSVWPRRIMLDGLNTMAQKSVISARMAAPSPTRWNPAGVCCHEFATTIHTAENIPPMETMSVEKKCIFADTRSHPNTSTARNPDSRKNAKIPSAASAEPNTSPTNRE